VNSFADQIITLDGLIRVETRKSRAIFEQSELESRTLVDQSQVDGSVGKNHSCRYNVVFIK
jgi:hypothetical protein